MIAICYSRSSATADSLLGQARDLGEGVMEAPVSTRDLVLEAVSRAPIGTIFIPADGVSVDMLSFALSHRKDVGGLALLPGHSARGKTARRILGFAHAERAGIKIPDGTCLIESESDALELARTCDVCITRPESGWEEWSVHLAEDAHRFVGRLGHGTAPGVEHLCVEVYLEGERLVSRQFMVTARGHEPRRAARECLLTPVDDGGISDAAKVFASAVTGYEKRNGVFATHWVVSGPGITLIDFFAGFPPPFVDRFGNFVSSVASVLRGGKWDWCQGEGFLWRDPVEVERAVP